MSKHFFVMDSRHWKFYRTHHRLDVLLCHFCHCEVQMGEAAVTKSRTGKFKLYHRTCWESLYFDNEDSGDDNLNVPLAEA